MKVVIDKPEHSTYQSVDGIAYVYVPHDELVFEQRRLLRRSENQVDVEDEKGNVETLNAHAVLSVPRYPETGYADMTQLEFLHEASILANLERRFINDLIYTFIDDILISVNPFKTLPIYSLETQQQYFSADKAWNQPHLYSFTDSIYRKMVGQQQDQSIVINGESGAGKTEAKKIILQYVASLSGNTPEQGITRVHDRVMASNPILEALGNAATVRNRNSSRFGKLLQAQFNGRGALAGAKFDVYLLEKSRVTTQNEGEQNFHVFYQLLAGAGKAHQEKWHLGTASSFNFLSRRDCEEPQERCIESYREVERAFQVCGFSGEQFEDTMAALATILHIGNLEFSNDQNEHAQSTNENVLGIVSSMLQCSSEELETAMKQQSHRIRDEVIVFPSNEEQARDTRDTLAQRMYECLFLHVVNELTQYLKSKEPCKRCLNVLDMFGFESFDHNTYEQMCINYANERLQLLFNQSIFQQELFVYAEEGIDTKGITFTDNQPCIDLFETKPLGILLLVHEESNFPRGTDESLLRKIESHHSQNTHFRVDRFKGSLFSIKHYSGEVTYDINSFLVKNRQRFSIDLARLVQNSGSEFIRTLFKDALNSSAPSRPTSASNKGARSGGARKAPTLILQFRDSLVKLSERLAANQPNFVRCIKSNSQCRPNTLDLRMVSDQLRDLGVLEAVRIRSEGFPQRLSFTELCRRFRYLIDTSPDDGASSYQKPRDQAAKLLNRQLRTTQFMLGRTRAFLKQDAFDQLEHNASIVRTEAAVTIQRCIRGLWCRRWYVHYRREMAAKNIQAAFTAFACQGTWKTSREATAARTVQRFYRDRRARARVDHVIAIQAYCRTLLALRYVQCAMETAADATREPAITELSEALTALRRGFPSLTDAATVIREAVTTSESARKQALDGGVIDLLLTAIADRPNQDHNAKQVFVQTLETVVLPSEMALAIVSHNDAIASLLQSHTMSLEFVCALANVVDAQRLADIGALAYIRQVLFRCCGEDDDGHISKVALSALLAFLNIVQISAKAVLIVWKSEPELLKATSVLLYCRPGDDELTTAATRCLLAMTPTKISTDAVIRSGGVEAAVQAFRFHRSNHQLFEVLAQLLMNSRVLRNAELQALLEDLAESPLSLAVSALNQNVSVGAAAELANAILHTFPELLGAFRNIRGTRALLGSLKNSATDASERDLERQLRLLRNLALAHAFGSEHDDAIDICVHVLRHITSVASERTSTAGSISFLEQGSKSEVASNWSVTVYAMECLRALGASSDAATLATADAMHMHPHDEAVLNAGQALLKNSGDAVSAALRRLRHRRARGDASLTLDVRLIEAAALSKKLCETVVALGGVSVLAQCSVANPNIADASLRGLARILLRDRDARVQFAQMDGGRLIGEIVKTLADEPNVQAAVIDVCKIVVQTGIVDAKPALLDLVTVVLSNLKGCPEVIVVSCAHLVLVLAKRGLAVGIVVDLEVHLVLLDALESQTNVGSGLIETLVDTIAVLSRHSVVWSIRYGQRLAQVLVRASRRCVKARRWSASWRCLELLKHASNRLLMDGLPLSEARSEEVVDLLLFVVEHNAKDLASDDAKASFKQASFLLNTLSPEPFREHTLAQLRRKVHLLATTSPRKGQASCSSMLQQTALIAYWCLSDAIADRLVSDLQVISAIVDALYALRETNESPDRRTNFQRLVKALERLSRHDSIQESLRRAEVSTALKELSTSFRHYPMVNERTRRCIANLSGHRSRTANKVGTGLWRLKNFLLRGIVSGNTSQHHLSPGVANAEEDPPMSPQLSRDFNNS